MDLDYTHFYVGIQLSSTFTMLAFFRLIHPVNYAGILHWYMSQPVMIEHCFNVLNTLPLATSNMRLFPHWKKLLYKFWWLKSHIVWKRLITLYYKQVFFRHINVFKYCSLYSIVWLFKNYSCSTKERTYGCGIKVRCLTRCLGTGIPLDHWQSLCSNKLIQ